MRRGRSPALVAAALVGLLAAAATAEGEPADLSPAATVDAFHAALAAAEHGRALSYLSPQLVVFEDGHAQDSRGEYASHHLRADVEMAMGTRRTVLKRRERVGERQAHVVSWTRVDGTVRGTPVERTLLETMLLTRGADGWRITHIHWSSPR